MLRRAEEVAERFPIVAERRHAQAGSLSGGEQKIVEIARALMLEPELLLMDEPSTGLEPRARHAVFETIRELNEAGPTVLLVEQNARSGLAIAHQGAVMEGGVVRLEGSGKRAVARPRGGAPVPGDGAARPRRAAEERRDDVAELGFVGLGVMGGRIAKRLLDAGHDVVGSTARARRRSGWATAACDSPTRPARSPSRATSSSAW